MTRLLKVLLVTALVAGCASTPPLATDDEDRRAKNLIPSPGKTVVYVARPQTALGKKEKKGPSTDVLLDDAAIGKTLDGHFLVTEVLPGKHIVSVSWRGMRRYDLEIDFKSERIYYVMETVTEDGFFYNVALQLTDEAEGKALLEKCRLSLIR